VVATVAGARGGVRGGRACHPGSDAGRGGPRPGGAATHLACLSPPLRAAARGLRAAPARGLVNRRGGRNVGTEQRQREAAPLPGDSPAARGAQRHTMSRCLTERTLMLLQEGDVSALVEDLAGTLFATSEDTAAGDQSAVDVADEAAASFDEDDELALLFEGP